MTRASLHSQDLWGEDELPGEKLPVDSVYSSWVRMGAFCRRGCIFMGCLTEACCIGNYFLKGQCLS